MEALSSFPRSYLLAKASAAPSPSSSALPRQIASTAGAAGCPLGTATATVGTCPHITLLLASVRHLVTSPIELCAGQGGGRQPGDLTHGAPHRQWPPPFSHDDHLMDPSEVNTIVVDTELFPDLAASSVAGDDGGLGSNLGLADLDLGSSVFLLLKINF
jgi:hypothetical protein